MKNQNKAGVKRHRSSDILIPDSGKGMKRAPTAGQLRALSNVCGNCKALCCRRFSMSLPIVAGSYRDGKAEIDWVAWRRKITAAGAPSDEIADIAFIRRNFAVVRMQPHAYYIDAYTTVMTCKRLDTGTGKCRAYKTRPAICRKYVCGAALYDGHPPDWEQGQKMQACSPDEGLRGLMGFKPALTPDPLWRRTWGRKWKRERKREYEVLAPVESLRGTITAADAESAKEVEG